MALSKNTAAKTMQQSNKMEQIIEYEEIRSQCFCPGFFFVGPLMRRAYFVLFHWLDLLISANVCLTRKTVSHTRAHIHRQYKQI